LPGGLVSRRALPAVKVIPPSGPSQGSNSYSFQPPPAGHPATGVMLAAHAWAKRRTCFLGVHLCLCIALGLLSLCKIIVISWSSWQLPTIRIKVSKLMPWRFPSRPEVGELSFIMTIRVVGKSIVVSSFEFEGKKKRWNEVSNYIQISLW
jgi:hypothetical protein